ncbi:hypothetical protein GQ457_11G025400 [Hibiscus cannabinus]
MANIIGEEDDQNQMDLPPGFRFHPTDEELISHYLYNKVVALNFTAKAIGEVDLNKSEPWDLPWKAKMGEKECHEYRLDGKFSVQNLPKSAKNEWVICRVFQKSCSGKRTPFSDASLMETSSTNGKTRGFPDSTTAYVPCFSNPIDFQTKKQDTVAVADPFNSVLLPVPRNSPNILPNPFFSFPATFLIQNRPILKALVDNHGPHMKMDTAEISGEAFNMDCFLRF